MNCKRCGSPLPNEGIVCKFCGAAMDQQQLMKRNQMRNKDAKRIMLLSEKYGQENNIGYREKKENKALGMIIIVLVLVFLIILTILLNK